MNTKTLATVAISTIVLSVFSALFTPSAQAADIVDSTETKCGLAPTQTCSLQNLINKITTAGPLIDITQESGVQTFQAIGNTTTSQYLFSVAGFAKYNTFGIYKLGDPTVTLELFNGGNPGTTAGSQTAVSFLSNGSVTVGNKTIQNFGDQFGFYLDRKVKSPMTLYSENSLNKSENPLVAGAQQMVTYQGNGQTQLTIGGITQLFTQDKFIVSIEDLRIGKYSDEDYNDLAILVSGIRDSKAVPEPTALLSLAAIGGVMALRRKQRIAQ